MLYVSTAPLGVEPAPVPKLTTFAMVTCTLLYWVPLTMTLGIDKTPVCVLKLSAHQAL